MLLPQSSERHTPAAPTQSSSSLVVLLPPQVMIREVLFKRPNERIGMGRRFLRGGVASARARLLPPIDSVSRQSKVKSRAFPERRFQQMRPPWRPTTQRQMARRCRYGAPVSRRHAFEKSEGLLGICGSMAMPCPAPKTASHHHGTHSYSNWRDLLGGVLNGVHHETLKSLTVGADRR